jgi:hypothetical protein
MLVQHKAWRKSDGVQHTCVLPRASARCGRRSSSRRTYLGVSTVQTKLRASPASASHTNVAELMAMSLGVHATERFRWLDDLSDIFLAIDLYSQGDGGDIRKCLEGRLLCLLNAFHFHCWSWSFSMKGFLVMLKCESHACTVFSRRSCGTCWASSTGLYVVSDHMFAYSSSAAAAMALSCCAS